MSETAPDFKLSEPRTLRAADRERYAAMYGASWRTIYNWVEIGEAAKDPCPLDEPGEMPKWWSRNRKHRVPPGIEKAAGCIPFAAKQHVEQTTDGAAQTEKVTAPKVFSLEDFDPEEGDRIRELKQLQRVRYQKIQDATERDEDVDSKLRAYLQFCDTLDKIESRALDRLKKMGVFVSRAEVNADLAANAEMLRQMSASMERRVLERCSSLSSEQRDEVASAIRAARAAEEKTFSRLNTLSPEELEFELAS
jgi:hypothetical protein